MSAAASPPPTVRVIAFNKANVQHMKTVNVILTKTADVHNQVKTHLQVTTPIDHQQKTVMDSGGTVNGLPTIHIAGYAGPA